MNLHRWYDWYHPVLGLLGRDGDAQEPPRGHDLWYVHVNWLERWQRPFFEGQQNRLGFVTTYDYSTIREHPDVCWKVFDLQNDGFNLVMGWWPQPGGDGRIKPADLNGAEVRLFWRWYWINHRIVGQWLGVRRWIWYKALHAAVHEKIPFTCQAVPPKSSGGYDHWHCQLQKKHTEQPHRFRNYTW